MGQYGAMTVAEYDMDIRRRMDRRAQAIASELQQRPKVAGDYEASQHAAIRMTDFRERRMDDEWTGQGRQDAIFLIDYLTTVRELYNQELSAKGYWMFLSTWINDKKRFGGRSILDQLLWVKFLIPQYDLPFLKGTPFGKLITFHELNQFRRLMRLNPFFIGSKVGDKQPVTPTDIQRVMKEFDRMKSDPTKAAVIHDTTEDMEKFEEWVTSPLAADLVGQGAVDKALAPIRGLGEAKSNPKTKTCPTDMRILSPPSFAVSAMNCIVFPRSFRFAPIVRRKH